MSTQRIILTVLAGLIIVGGLATFIIWNDDQNVVTPNIPVGEDVNSYTMAEVKTHNSATSCWAAVNGKVYDLTKWIGSHPGGRAAILSLCGQDGSSAFNTQHSTTEEAQEKIASFEIGDLKN